MRLNAQSRGLERRCDRESPFDGLHSGAPHHAREHDVSSVRLDREPSSEGNLDIDVRTLLLRRQRLNHETVRGPADIESLGPVRIAPTPPCLHMPPIDNLDGHPSVLVHDLGRLSEAACGHKQRG